MNQKKRIALTTTFAGLVCGFVLTQQPAGAVAQPQTPAAPQATSGYLQGSKYISKDLMNLTGSDQVTTYDRDSKPAFTQTTETKTKDRTIVIHQPDGNTKTEIQSVMVSRTITRMRTAPRLMETGRPPNGMVTQFPSLPVILPASVKYRRRQWTGIRKTKPLMFTMHRRNKQWRFNI